MGLDQDIPLIYEGGVHKPEGRVDLSEGARGITRIHSDSWNAEVGHRAMEEIRRISESGAFNSSGTKLTRDQMHEHR